MRFEFTFPAKLANIIRTIHFFFGWAICATAREAGEPSEPTILPPNMQENVANAAGPIELVLHDCGEVVRGETPLDDQ